MDRSKSNKLALNFATIALVFSVSACVLSHSINDEQEMAKTPVSEPAAVDQSQVKAAIDANHKRGAAKPLAKSAAKPGSIMDTNQKVTKLAETGKLDGVRMEPRRTVATPNKRVARYVSAETLNVRSHASMEAPVVGKLTKGTMYYVLIEGIWARIGDNQYVMTKFLTNQSPKKPSSWTYRK